MFISSLGSHLRLVPAAARTFDQQVNGVILRHHPDLTLLSARRQTHCSEDYSGIRETETAASARVNAHGEQGFEQRAEHKLLPRAP